jgi:hypothetical protein
VDLEHWLWHLIREIAHSSAFAGGEYDSFHRAQIKAGCEAG